MAQPARDAAAVDAAADTSVLAAAFRAVIERATAPAGAGPLDPETVGALRAFLAAVPETASSIQAQREALDRRFRELRSAAAVATRLLREATGEEAAVPGPDGRSRAEGFGHHAVPIAERLIGERGGAVTVDEIFANMPAAVRVEMASATSPYSPVFRLRRLFRRHKRFVVDRRTGLVSIAPEKPTKPLRVRRIVWYTDGRIQGLEVSDERGARSVIARDVAKRLIREGAVFTVDIGLGEGRLEIVDNGFRVRRDGVLKTDFLRLPHVTERKLALESGGEDGGDVAK